MTIYDPISNQEHCAKIYKTLDQEKLNSQICDFSIKGHNSETKYAMITKFELDTCFAL
jgi:hypothetical protein